MKIESFDRSVCRALQERALALLKPLASELGVSVQFKGGRFEDASCTIKFEFSVISEDGTVKNREAIDYARLHELYGLPADGLGRIIKWGGKTMKITGLRTGRSKYPICATDVSSGKNYCIPLHALQ